jgi:hypothetical protein
MDELFKIIQESGRQTVVENENVPNEHNEDVMREAHSSIVNGLKSQGASGQLQGLLGSLQGGAAQGNPAVQQISTDFIGNITRKFGINPGTAASIASAIIPMVLGKMAGKAHQQGSGFDLGSLISSFTTGNTAGNTTGAGGLAGKFGLDKDGDGDVDLGDLTKMFK